MNTTEHHDPALRHAFISLTKFVDTLVNEKVLNENDELRLVFLKWRTNNFNNRWTIEHPSYQVKRNDEIKWGAKPSRRAKIVPLFTIVMFISYLVKAHRK